MLTNEIYYCKAAPRNHIILNCRFVQFDWIQPQVKWKERVKGSVFLQFHLDVISVPLNLWETETETTEAQRFQQHASIQSIKPSASDYQFFWLWRFYFTNTSHLFFADENMSGRRSVCVL